MSRKVIHRDFHTLSLFEFAQGVCQQVEVKGVGVVKVVVVAGSPDLLFSRKDLRTRQEPVFSWFLTNSEAFFFFFLDKVHLLKAGKHLGTGWCLTGGKVWGPKFRMPSCSSVTSAAESVCVRAFRRAAPLNCRSGIWHNTREETADSQSNTKTRKWWIKQNSAEMNEAQSGYGSLRKKNPKKRFLVGQCAEGQF